MSSLLTPPGTLHRSDKENHAASRVSKIVWSLHNQYHPLDSPLKANVPPSAFKLTPVKSILKRRSRDSLPATEEKQREITPEPADPLVNLTYLDSPVSKIIVFDASLRDLIESYNILAARLRACVSGSTDADASWPLFQPLRKNSKVFVNCLVRDLGQALADPLASSECSISCQDNAKFALPSPKHSPKKIKQGMSAEQVKHARDLCTICHSVLKLLTVIFTIPALYNIFTNGQLRDMMTAVLSIPLTDVLPTPNARKTCALAIGLIQIQRLPAEVLMPSRDRIAYAIRRGIDGELGKEGKKGSISDGLKAIHDLCIYQPATFVPAFAELLPSILSILLAPTLALRTQACHALGGLAVGCSSTPRSFLHTRISNTVAEFITAAAPENKKSPVKSNEPLVVRTLRTTLGAIDPSHVAQGPVWALSVLASFLVLLGPLLCCDTKINRILSALLALAMRHEKSSIRALGCLVWRPVAWVHFQPPLLSDPDNEEEIDRSVAADLLAKEAMARDAHWKVVRTVVELQAGVSTIAASLGEIPGDDGIQKAIDILKIMVTKNAQTCGDAVESLKQMVGGETQRLEWDIGKLLPCSLFSSQPGLLTVDYNNLNVTIRSIFDEVPVIDDIRPLSKEEIAKDWVFDEFMVVWRKALSSVVVFDNSKAPSDLVSIWDCLLRSNISCITESDEFDRLSDFAIRAVTVLVDILQDVSLDMKDAHKRILPPTNLDPDGHVLNEIGATKENNGFLKLKIIQTLWDSMRAMFPIDQLKAASEKLFVCLVDNEEELVESRDRTRIQWVSTIMETLIVFDCDSLRFWGFEPFNQGKFSSWAWTPDTRSLVWRTSMQKWKDGGGHWEGASVLLGIPFTDMYGWAISPDDCHRWDTLLEYACSKALDFGVDSNTVLDSIANFISQHQIPSATTFVRAAELLMSHTELEDARDIPESALDYVNDIMCSTYPPGPRCKQESRWLCRALQSVIEQCPPELCMRLLEILQEGLCLWFSDEYHAWTMEELLYDIIPLYEHFLVRIRALPRTLSTLEALSPILESIFAGRKDVIARVRDSFADYWEATYSKVPAPAGGWPKILAPYIRGYVQAPSQTELSIISCPGTLQSPFVVPAQPKASDASHHDVIDLTGSLMPITPVSMRSFPSSSPLRPHKPATNLFDTYPLQTSPGSPINTQCNSDMKTPKRPLQRIPQFSLSPGGLAHKRRRMEDGWNKENSTFEPVMSCAEKIAQSSPEAIFGVKPFSLGKRSVTGEDLGETRPSPLKRGRMNKICDQSPVPVALHTPSTQELEEERQVAASLLETSIPIPVIRDVFAAGFQADISHALQPYPKKRKRVFMDAVEVPTISRCRELKYSASSDSLCLGSKTATSFKPVEEWRSASRNQKHSRDVTLKRRCSEGSNLPLLHISLKPKPIASLCIPGSDESDIILQSRRRHPSPRSNPKPLSSDDDPHIGQVTPHHLISPPLRKSLYKDETNDLSSDDPPSSPLRHVAARRMQRAASLRS